MTSEAPSRPPSPAVESNSQPVEAPVASVSTITQLKRLRARRIYYIKRINKEGISEEGRNRATAALNLILQQIATLTNRPVESITNVYHPGKRGRPIRT